MAATKGQLKRLDLKVREAVRAFLHLPRDTPVGYFHAGVREGGIGIASLSTRIPRLRADLLQRLGGSADPAVANVAEAMRDRPDNAISSAVRRRAEVSRWSRKLYEAVDGAGLRGADLSPGSSTWIDDGTLLMSGGDFIRAIRCRGNLLYTKARAARGRRVENINCDLCRNHPETLGHILQRCPGTHGSRTRRHDRVLDVLVQSLT